jgi:hypothetical protein
MNANEKGRYRFYGATPIASDRCKFTAVTQRFAGLDRSCQTIAKTENQVRSACKTLIVRVALRGFIPPRFATWLIKAGGLLDA